MCEDHLIIMSAALGCCVTSSPNLFWVVGCGKVCSLRGPMLLVDILGLFGPLVCRLPETELG